MTDLDDEIYDIIIAPHHFVFEEFVQPKINNSILKIIKQSQGKIQEPEISNI